MERYGYEADGRCPLCGDVDKGMHFGGCRSIKLKEERRRIIGNMMSGMAEEGINPFFVGWFKTVLRGEIPGWEEITPLGLNQVVKRAYEEQSSIGWKHMLRGRVANGMVQAQGEWSKRFGKEVNRRKESEMVVAGALTYGVLAVYRLWKARCEEVAKIELPTRVRVKMRVVDELREEIDMVEARDRFLFEDGNVPQCGDCLQRVEDWIECVKRAKVRALKRITLGNDEMTRYVA